MQSFVGVRRLSGWSRGLLYCAFCFGLLFVSHVSHAQNLDAKLFDPVASPHGIIGVHTSRSMRHLSLVGQLTTNYANDILIGRSNTSVAIRPIAHRLTAELGLAFGLLGWLEFGLSMPIYLYQVNTGYTPGSPGRIAKGSQGRTLLGDLRFYAKGQILKNSSFKGFGLALALEVNFPTGTRDALAGDQSLIFAPRLIADFRTQNGFVVAFNFAYRIRAQQRFFNLNIDDELRFALGAELPLFFSRLSLLGEALLSVGIPQFSNGSGQTNISTEFRTGLRWRHTSGVMLTTGVGLGVTGGFGAPDFRFFIDINFGRNVKTGKMQEDLPPVYPVQYMSSAPATHSSQQQKDKKSVGPDGRMIVRNKYGKEPKRKSGVFAQKEIEPPPARTAQLSPKAFDKAAASDPDPDGDGIPSSLDQCPHRSEDFDQFQDKDGCPDLDNDKDGIVDTKDQCPLKPETINGIRDEDGCPDKGQSKILLTKGRIKISEKVYFNSGSDKLKKRSFGILRQLASFLKANWQIQAVRIEGYTDSRGDKEMNVDLSERRARRVMAFLVEQGVKVRILKARGYGPKFPIATNRTSKGRALNRRVTFKVLKVFVPPTKRTRKGSGS